jgi:ATP-dependent DNA helicase PIF1
MAEEKEPGSEQKNRDIDTSFETILDYVYEGKNIFLTGPGGVGKSYYIKKLKEMDKKIIITSTTGVSSYNLGGQTIHSFSGIGAVRERESYESVLKRVKKNKGNIDRWKSCKILVIDEISMLGKKILDILDRLACQLRDNQKPFGGIQVIFTGDFLQLPPVNDQFAFHSPVWDRLDLKVIYLKKMHRVADPIFTSLLERIRKGQPSPEDNVLLFSRERAFKAWEREMEDEKKENNNHIWTKLLPTFMYSKKVDVHEQNMEELEKNPNPILRFPPVYISAKTKIERIVEEESLLLKIGAQVMLTVNIDTEAGLVNGSRGVVVNYDGETKLLYVRFFDGRELAFGTHQYVFENEDGSVSHYMNQYPFILAYALSIHKVQGCTLDYAIIDIGFSVFENSMSYVALSIVRSLDGLLLKSYQPNRVKCHSDALAFYKELEEDI